MPDAKEWLKRRPWFRPLRAARLGRAIRRDGHPDWGAIAAADADRWAGALAGRSDGRRVLIATTVGIHRPAMIVDPALAVALTLAGAEAEFLLCDRAIPACMASEVTWYPDIGVFLKHGARRDLCRHCEGPAAGALSGLGLPIRRLSESLRPGDEAEAEALAAACDPAALQSLELDGLAIGEQALAATLRFFARGTLAEEPAAEAVARRYVAAAVLVARAGQRLFAERRYDAVVLHHGIYVPQGILQQAARAAGVRVVTWAPGYRARTFLFSHEASYHYTMLAEPEDHWTGFAFDAARRAAVTDYLHRRSRGESVDWIVYQDRAEESRAALRRETGLSFEKPTVALLTNVVWDAQLFYAGAAFPSMIDFVIETIRWFAGRPDLDLAIRIHPAETRHPMRSRQPMAAEIAGAFRQLPGNVRVIGPESSLNTYALAEQCDAALVYGSKIGLELAALGMPVIVAGEAWARNKGFTCDAATPEAYFALLDRLPFGERLDEARRDRALRYAYHYIFRRMIPVGFVEPTGGWPPFRLAGVGLEDFAPGRDPGLAAILAGILDDRPFIHDV